MLFTVLIKEESDTLKSWVIFIRLQHSVKETLLIIYNNSSSSSLVSESFSRSLFSISSWAVLCNGGGLFRRQVGHISVAYLFFSWQQHLFLFLFYRIVVTWLSYSVSGNVKFGPTCLPFSACSHHPHRHLELAVLMLRKPTKSSCFLEDIRVSFGCKREISTKH